MTIAFRSGASDAGILINGVEEVTIDSTGITSGIPDSSITPAKLSQKLTSGTAVASTSGTSIDFTGIPSWAKRITVMFNGVSKSGTSDTLVQIGDSGGIEATGYLSTSGQMYNSAASAIAYSTGFGIQSGNAAMTIKGTMVLTNINSNNWIATHSTGSEVTGVGSLNAQGGGGNKSLSASLSQVRITSVNGTDTFDAGSINILYE